MFEGQMPLKLTGAKAGAGLTGAGIQYTFVKLSADNTVVPCSGVTDIPIGVIQAPVRSTGDPVDVVVVGMTNLQNNGTIANAGDQVGTAAAGTGAKYTAADTTKYNVGVVVAVAGGTASGNLVTALINCAAPVKFA